MRWILGAISSFGRRIFGGKWQFAVVKNVRCDVACDSAESRIRHLRTWAGELEPVPKFRRTAKETINLGVLGGKLDYFWVQTGRNQSI